MIEVENKRVVLKGKGIKGEDAITEFICIGKGKLYLEEGSYQVLSIEDVRKQKSGEVK